MYYITGLYPICILKSLRIELARNGSFAKKHTRAIHSVTLCAWETCTRDIVNQTIPLPIFERNADAFGSQKNISQRMLHPHISITTVSNPSSTSHTASNASHPTQQHRPHTLSYHIHCKRTDCRQKSHRQSPYQRPCHRPPPAAKRRSLHNAAPPRTDSAVALDGIWAARAAQGASRMHATSISAVWRREWRGVVATGARARRGRVLRAGVCVAP